ncbi:MAG TPA: hypothetical protein VMZ53_13180 [Kofleriaceae bacterium]|nr:hypothetical protein [Kofleriaceae bacterium]
MTLIGLSGTAWGGAALDDAGSPQRTTDPNASPDTPATAEPKLEYGVDIRLRHVMIPQGLVELFVERAAGGSGNNGIGLDLVRRRGNLELQLGFEFEHIEPGEGVWINKGDNVAGGDEADYIISAEHAGKSLGWFTLEFTFLNHAPINKYLAVRYGGGAGIGIITGELQHYDVICNGATNGNPEPGCVPPAFGGTPQSSTGPVAYDFPPIFPVVNAIIGLQIRPAPKATINIEGGIRTVPFIGISAGYFFN